MTDRDSILIRLRKLMARTTENGCTEAEAAAVATASRLMAEHQISMDSVATADAGPAESMSDSEGYTIAGRWRAEYDWAATICRDFFLVQVYRTGNGINNRQFFFGTPTNIETAKFIYTSLLAAYERLWREYRARTGAKAGDRRAFTLGVTGGFRQKLREERRLAEAEREAEGRTGTEIVLVRAEGRIKAAFDEKHKNMRSAGLSPVNESPDALAAGREAGRRMSLARPIGGNGAKGLPGS